MKVIAQIQQPTAPASVPSQPTTLTEWGFLASAVVWGVGGIAVFAKRFGEWFVEKDKSESALTSNLIDDLRSDRVRVIESNQSGFATLATKLDTLTQAVILTNKETDQDVRSLMKTQSAIYASLNQSIGRLEATIKALHERMDNFGNFSPPEGGPKNHR